MLQTIENENRFVVKLLADLHNEHFSFTAWVHFLRSSWKKSRTTAKENPALKRSWMHISVFIGTFTLSLLIVNFIFEGPTVTLRLMPGFVFFVGWQQYDLYWHLGLYRDIRTGRLLQIIGTATIMTLLRGVGASYLLGRCIGGIHTPSWLVLLIFLCGIMTDILDGQIARRTQTQTRYGQIADGEADFCLYLATTCIMILDHILPPWFGLFLLLRFLVPLLAAIVSYFLFTHPVRFGSTFWGKAAGLALSFFLLLLLAPGQWIFLTRLFEGPLLIATLFLLAFAPFAQIVRNIQDGKFS